MDRLLRRTIVVGSLLASWCATSACGRSGNGAATAADANNGAGGAGTAADANSEAGGATSGCPLSSPLADANVRRASLMKLVSDAALSPFSSNPTIRQYTFMALYLLALKPNRADADVSTAKGYISTAFQSQCADASTCGTSYGLIRFHRDDPQYDYNSTAFTLQGLAPVLAGYRDKFSPAELDALRPNIDAALSALDTQGPKPAYTNIFLMRATDLVLIGEALLPLDTKYQHFIDRGYQLLDDWKAHTTQFGIDEFDSPSYAAADLDSLVIGYLHAKQKPRYAAMLDYFWTDLGANFFAARGSMSGPHSRDYQFLTGFGAVDWYLYMAGWRTQIPADTSSSDPPLERVFVAYNLQKGGYEPSSEACSVAFAHPKRVTQLWGDVTLGYDRSNFVGARFALGGVNHDYDLGPQEKVVTLELAGTDTVVSLVTEDDQTADNPYGAKTQQGNFTKPFRLPSFPVIAQKDGLLLATSYATPLASHTTTTLLASNLLLPPDATISRNGTRVTAAVDLTPNDVIDVRVGNAVGVLRILRADDCGGNRATPHLLFEKSSAGATVDRARIVVYHANGVSAAGCAARLSFLLAGEECATSGCVVPAALGAATLDEATSPNWKTTVTIAHDTLSVERSDDFATNRHAIVSRTVNGLAFSTSLIELNGKNVAPTL